MFKGASQNTRRRVGRSSKGEQAARARKLDMIADAKASKAVRGKLKNMEDGQAARAEKLKMRAAHQRPAVDPTKPRKQAKKIAAKLAERMRNVIVEVRSPDEAPYRSWRLPFLKATTPSHVGKFDCI